MKNYFRILKSYLKEYQKLTAICLCALFFQALVIVFFQIAYKEIFDGVSLNKPIGFLLFWVALILSAAVFRICIGLLIDYLAGKLSLKIFGNIRLRLFQKLQWFPAEFYQRVHLGDLISHYSNDLQQSEMCTRQLLPRVIRGVYLAFISWTVLFFFNWQLTLLSIALFPFVILGAFLLVKRASEATRLTSEANSELSCMMEEVATQHQLLQAFNLQSSFFAKFQKKIASSETKFLGGIFLRATVGQTSIFGLSVVEILIFSVGAFMAHQGMMTIGTLFGFFALMWNISGTISTLSAVSPNLIEAGAHMDRLQTLLSEKTDEPIPCERGLQSATLDHSIELKNVTLTYSSRDALKDVNLKINKGEKIGLVGSTGSGKSSILSLLLGFYSSTEGNIFLDDTEMRLIDKESLRGHIGVVLQHNPLFNTTILENIRIGKLSASEDEVIEAAKMAEIHDFIESLPDGYHTLVKEYGTNLSGGQKQRIALARAYLRNAPLLLLDEPTSALDPLIAAQISENIRRFSQDKTVILSTHRLGNLKAMDRIVVLEKGKVKEEGSHAQLMEKEGLYFAMWNKQHTTHFKTPKELAIDLERLRAIPLFHNYSEEALKSVADKFVMEWKEEGTVIPESEYIEKFFLIARGSVELQKVGMDPFHDPLRVLEEGDYFGESSFFDNLHHETQIVTRTHCVFMVLHMSELNS